MTHAATGGRFAVRSDKSDRGENVNSPDDPDLHRVLRLPEQPLGKEGAGNWFRPGGPFDPSAGDAAEGADIFEVSQTGPFDVQGPRAVAAALFLAVMWLYIGRYSYECVYLTGGVNTPGTWCAW
mmetsp:Transcript_105605/g.268251  ORF Transcript_105605/g.268251 Transcript_105605/m.268251 type:complete len:124 (+) Transcript_105605:1-372(+)